jgi:hypothetical protein
MKHLSLKEKIGFFALMILVFAADMVLFQRFYTPWHMLWIAPITVAEIFFIIHIFSELAQERSLKKNVHDYNSTRRQLLITKLNTQIPLYQCVSADRTKAKCLSCGHLGLHEHSEKCSEACLNINVIFNSNE